MKIAEYIELVKQAERTLGNAPVPPPFKGKMEPTMPGQPPKVSSEVLITDDANANSTYNIWKAPVSVTAKNTLNTLVDSYLPESARERLSPTYNKIKDYVSKQYNGAKNGRVGKVAKSINRFGDAMMKRLNPLVVPTFALADTIPSRMKFLQKSVDEGNPMTFSEGMEHYAKGVGSLAPQISLPMRLNPFFWAQLGIDIAGDKLGLDPDTYPGMYTPSAEDRLATEREIPLSNYDHVNPYEYSYNRTKHYIPNYVADLYGGIFDLPYQLLRVSPSVNLSLPTTRRKHDVWRSPEDMKNMLDEGWASNYIDFVNAKNGKEDEGREVIDYPKMFSRFGGKSWEEINPERSRQELHNVPEYMRQAFLNGFTGKEIMPAMYSYWDKYRADTNTLPAMTADPASLAKYMLYEGRTPRQVADSSIYRKLYPFIANRADAGTPVLPEEREALNTYLIQNRLAQELGKLSTTINTDSKKRKEVEDAYSLYGRNYWKTFKKEPSISLYTQDTPAFLPEHKGDSYLKLEGDNQIYKTNVHQQRYALRQLANADVITRYEYLYSNPELVKPFVDYYFENPKDKEQFIDNFNAFKDKLDNNTAFVGPLSTSNWWKKNPRYADLEEVLNNKGQGVDTAIDKSSPFYTEITNWDKMVESGEDEDFLQKLSIPERIIFLKAVSEYWKNN